MPDSFDYEWLGELLARPHVWTEADLATVQGILENQKRVLEEMHPEDKRGRRTAQELLDQLESALQTAQRARRGR